MNDSISHYRSSFVSRHQEVYERRWANCFVQSTIIYAIWIEFDTACKSIIYCIWRYQRTSTVDVKKIAIDAWHQQIAINSDFSWNLQKKKSKEMHAKLKRNQFCHFFLEKSLKNTRLCEVLNAKRSIERWAIYGADFMRNVWLTERKCVLEKRSPAKWVHELQIQHKMEEYMLICFCQCYSHVNTDHFGKYLFSNKHFDSNKICGTKHKMLFKPKRLVLH